MGLAFSQDGLRQLCTLALLRPWLKRQGDSPRILVIGDGFGTLAGLLRAYFPQAVIHLVDLSFALAEQKTRLTGAFGSEGFEFHHAGDIDGIAQTVRYDLAINVASMQEMNPGEVARYFDFLRARADLFYCCNRERKMLPDGTVPIFMEYPWSARDAVAFDELCPWHQWFISARPPFLRRYDGPIRHRLVRLEATCTGKTSSRHPAG